MSGRLGGRLVLASHNAGKLKEMSSLLAPFGVEVRSAASFGLEEPAETEATFAGNARIKAHVAAQGTGLPSLADDSGLEVDALDGAPGVFTADWAETPTGRDYPMAMAKVHDALLAKLTARPWTGRFRSTLCLAWPDGTDEIFEGSVEGELVWPPRGMNGFGFDPMFAPEGSPLTFGEMSHEAKQAISHRARALARFIDGCLA